MCDTFVAMPDATADGSVIFGKNSDREPNEAQVLEYYPGGRHPAGSTVQCTYVRVPQSRETRGILISRPFWMWGAEMGANKNGVVIGNEAVFTRMPISRKPALTGMDMLRLALERADSAESAMEVMIGLLADHGQGGVCGYEDKKMAYHNSYIIADPETAWVFETAGPLWIAEKIRHSRAISNGLTIGESFDRVHPDLIDTARRRGWLKKGRTFDFARCYSDWFFTTFSACRKRETRAAQRLKQRPSLSVADAVEILRDHGNSTYHPDRHWLGDRICAHAGMFLTRNATQTTGSLVGHLTPDAHGFFATATAAPCTGTFKPVWVEAGNLPDLGPTPDGVYDPRSLWWRHETLHRRILCDHPTRVAVMQEKQRQLEAAWRAQALTVRSAEERRALTASAFSEGMALDQEWLEAIENMPVSLFPGRLYRAYWNRQNRKANLPFSE